MARTNNVRDAETIEAEMKVVGQVLGDGFEISWAEFEQQFIVRFGKRGPGGVKPNSAIWFAILDLAEKAKR